jgi:UDP-N-acetylmuramoyl-L-alanyl-D-glutamate--2,6-diaminopimelate ligase
VASDTDPQALADLLDRLTAEGLAAQGSGDLATVVTGVTLDSRRVSAGDLYAAVPGAHAHGAAFWGEARDGGAVALLTDPQGAGIVGDAAPTLVVPEVRPALGRVSALVYGAPAEQLGMIGVTGTQGKTTTTRLIESGLSGAGVPAAVVGTVGTRILGEDVSSALTTPEAPDLHRLLRRMVDAGVRACAMEVSSHALVLGRVGGVVFDVAAFLNLGRDHLDFHRDMEDYFHAKATLFTREHARLGLVSIDDEWGRRLVEESEIPVRTMSANGHQADWVARDVVPSASGSSFVIHGPDGQPMRAGCPIPGGFNVANALAAVAAAASLGFEPELVARTIAAGPGVPGRLERIDEGQDFEVVVDYAHKPDALEAALATLRPLTRGRLIVVLGAGGDRDPGKRPFMGEIAARHGDVVVVTDDNPRSEDPAAIRRAILGGTTGGRAEVVEIPDRRRAVAEAVRRAASGDVVLIAGKGHETGQEVAGVMQPFDDRDVAREALSVEGRR